MSRVPLCPYCGAVSVLLTGADIYPHRTDLGHKQFYACQPCDAYVGCHQPHPNAAVVGYPLALGTLANAELRGWRNRAHAAFDPLWRDGRMTRKEAYARLQAELGTKKIDTHIAMFSVEQCERTVAAVARLLAA